MEIHVKNTYDLFFHPFGDKGLTKEGAGRLAASFAIFISTLGIYHLVIGAIQKYRISHPHIKDVPSTKTNAAFQEVLVPKTPTPAQVFFESHPEVMSPERWKKVAEEAGIHMESVTNETAFKALTKNRDLESKMNSPCKVFGEDKKIQDTHMLMYIPPGITFAHLSAIAKAQFPKSPKEGFSWLDEDAARSLDDQQAQGGWVLMTKAVIPDSKYNHNIDQWNMVKKLCDEKEGVHYEVPTPVEAITCLLGRYIATGERLFESEMTRCEGKSIGIGVDSQEHQVTVGYLGPNGLAIRMSLLRKRMQNCGIAALQRLS